MVPFAARLASLGYKELRAEEVRTLQVNLGWRCNQSCRHCHFSAGPTRSEQMDKDNVDAVIRVVQGCRIPVVDLTGGSPEINPYFEYLVERLAQAGAHIINRCNLTVLLEPGKEHLPEFFRRHRVELVCSLPYYQEEMVDRMRGPGVFQKSLEAMRRLNELGYGEEGSGFVLNLMSNPAGAYLPGPQRQLESLFRRELQRRYGIRFNRLYSLVNMPIGRFQEFLSRSHNYERYLHKLASSFNPATIPGLMCRHLISVSWEGRLHDCDFHQALGLPLEQGLPQHISDFDLSILKNRRIRLSDHCYGCTAGSGSSCGGSLAAET